MAKKSKAKTILQIVKEQELNRQIHESELKKVMEQNKEYFNSLVGKCFRDYYKFYKLTKLIEIKQSEASFECTTFGIKKQNEVNETLVITPHNSTINIQLCSAYRFKEIDDSMFIDNYNALNVLNFTNDGTFNMLKNLNKGEIINLKKYVNIVVSSIYNANELEDEDFEMTERQLKTKYKKRWHDYIDNIKNGVLLYKDYTTYHILFIDGIDEDNMINASMMNISQYDDDYVAYSITQSLRYSIATFDNILKNYRLYDKHTKQCLTKLKNDVLTIFK